jgi:hypothetical protein
MAPGSRRPRKHLAQGPWLAAADARGRDLELNHAGFPNREKRTCAVVGWIGGRSGGRKPKAVHP